MSSSGDGARAIGSSRWPWIKRVLAVVVAAVLANVVIAWASVFSVPNRTMGMGQGRSAFTEHRILYWGGSTCDRLAIEWSSLTASEWMPDIALQQFWRDSALDALFATGRDWPAPFDSAAVARAADRNPKWAGAVLDVRGWPLRAFRCEWVYDTTGLSVMGPQSIPVLRSVSGGIELAPKVRSPLEPVFPRALPFVPVWGGLLVNTLIFSAPVLIVMWAVALVRSSVRRRRNGCPRCGYSLAGQIEPGCPECGWKRSPSRTPNEPDTPDSRASVAISTPKEPATNSTRPRPSVRVWAVRLILAILAGAIVTVAVASASAYFLKLPASGVVIHQRMSHLLGVEMTRWSRPGVRRTVFVFEAPPATATWDREAVPRVVHDYSVESLRMFLMNVAWPGPGPKPEPVIEPKSPFQLWAGVIQDARGWPMPAFWCEWNYDPGKMRRPSRPPLLRRISGGFDFTPKSTVRAIMPNDLRAFPYRPIWLGLLVNTLFYATVFTLMLAVIAHVQTRRRIRRNLCPVCAYSLAGQAQPGCPECGWKRPENAANSPSDALVS